MNDLDNKEQRSNSPVRLWAGQGTGDPCSYCGKPIDPSDLEYEVRAQEPEPVFAAADSPRKFHLRCLDQWLNDPSPKGA